MKVYKGEHNKRSWSVILEQVYEGAVFVVAVDSDTGGFIANLIIFDETGEISTPMGAEHAIENAGYSPFEHGNRYDEHGRIIIGNRDK